MSDEPQVEEKPKPTKPTPTINHLFVSVHGPEGENMYWSWDQREMRELWGSKNPEEHCWACDGELQYHHTEETAKAAGVELEEPPELPTDFDVYCKTNTLFQMNTYGYCGFVLYSGKRCTNRIQAWFGDVEDPNGRVGACGVHAEAVQRDFDNNKTSRMDRQIQRFMYEEQDKAVNVLRNAGLQATQSGPSIVIRNWAVLLAWLDGKGLDFDERNWEVVAEERRLAELAKICQNCGKEHPMDPDAYGPGCDEHNYHKFFARKNKPDLCDVCGANPFAPLHDETQIKVMS